MSKLKEIIGMPDTNINNVTINNIDIHIRYYSDNSTYISFSFYNNVLFSYALSTKNGKTIIGGSNPTNIKYDNEILAIKTKDDLEKFCNKLLKQEIFK